VRQALVAKSSLTDAIARKLQEFNTVAVIDLQKVRGKQINEARRNLRTSAEFKQVKCTIARLAVRKVEGNMPGIEKISDHLSGMILLLFSNLDPFRLQAMLRKNITKLFAKAGDIAPDDITVPAGNTGMPPGPAISELNAVGITTRIDTGSVWVTKDTVVAKKNDKISVHLAAVLSKLNITPISSFLVIRAAFSDGLILMSDVLQVDVDNTRKELLEAFGATLRLSSEIWYATGENIALLVTRSAGQADVLSSEIWYPTSTNIRRLLSRAHQMASALGKPV
jgi:large subunit ribosomal protein L10